jgi:adenosylhomocysteine nucleosidase
MPRTLVCFAVKEEARPFQKLAAERTDLQVVLTGMGQRQAERTLRVILATEQPELVVSSGFAGGLRPELTTGAILFAVEGQPELQTALTAAGARPGRFHCVERVAATAALKRELWLNTRADAVEMESKSICAVCAERNVPCAVVRVILDTANEDLPLDFNEVMGADEQLNYGKLALKLVTSPSKLLALWHLQKQSAAAAEILADALIQALPADRLDSRGNPGRPAR